MTTVGTNGGSVLFSVSLTSAARGVRYRALASSGITAHYSAPRSPEADRTRRATVVARWQHPPVKTSEQPSAGPDEPARALTRQLADLAKTNGPRFAAVVRAADDAIAGGAQRDAAYRAALAAQASEGISALRHAAH